MNNALTVDVEEYFQVSAFEPYINKNDWDRFPSRVEASTEKLIDIFSEFNVKATFFILGWVAQRHQNLIRRISENGHEIACHGYSHVRVTQQTPQEFRYDVTKSKDIIENITGVQVRGYRAASYSICATNLWALNILDEIGFDYSSSIYPVHHDLYGMPEAPRFAFTPKNCVNLLEIPVSTINFINRNYHCGGGGYFRLYPYVLTRWAINRLNTIDNQSCVFYMHPWEIDQNQPRLYGIHNKTQIRHYLNLSKIENRLRRLLIDFNWDSMANIFSKKLTIT